MVASDVTTHESSWPPGGSAEAFGGVVDPYRRELLVHCYRMLGLHRRRRGRPPGRARQRVASTEHVSARRLVPGMAVPDRDERVPRCHRPPETPFGQRGPHRCRAVSGRAPRRSGRRRARGAVRRPRIDLARVPDGPPAAAAAPAGRLVLRDVLSWRAAEVAGLLDLSVPAVNSALQRARATVSRRYGQPGRSGPRVAPAQPQPGGLLERYVRAWESADVAGLVALLREDALLTMPPRPSVAGAARDRRVPRGVDARRRSSDAPGRRRARTAARRSSPTRTRAAASGSTRSRSWCSPSTGSFVAQIDAFVDPASSGGSGRRA